MSRVGEVLDFERTTDEGARVPVVKVDGGGGDVVTAEHYACAGDDSVPLPGDFAALEDSAGTGVEHCSGYLDPSTSPVASAGERRLYSRSGPGVVAASAYLKADGSIELTNAAGGYVKMAADGSLSVKGPAVKLSASGAPTQAFLRGTAFLSALTTWLAAHDTYIVIPTPTAPQTATYTTASANFSTALATVLSTVISGE